MNVGRSAPKGAVFLSYASQDAEAAKRIADALRAADVEVWFDQSELVGGDAWDAKIRRQIKECALFVPVISASTQARREGYFRLEWRLAVERMQHMDDDLPFLLPVVIDGTTDAGAFVPERFRAVQWTRLEGKDTPESLALRVRRLLRGSVEAGRPRPGERGEGAASPKNPRPAWLRYGWAGVGLVFALAYAARPFFQEGRRPESKPAAVVPDRWQRGDFEALSPQIDRILEKNPDNADAWALRSIIWSLQVTRNQDSGTKPLEAGKAAAGATRDPKLPPFDGVDLVSFLRGEKTDLAAKHPEVAARFAAAPAEWNRGLVAPMWAHNPFGGFINLPGPAAQPAKHRVSLSSPTLFFVP